MYISQSTDSYFLPQSIKIPLENKSESKDVLTTYIYWVLIVFYNRRKEKRWTNKITEAGREHTKKSSRGV